MTRNGKKWEELAERQASLDAIIADDGLRELALAALDEARPLAHGALGGSPEPEGAAAELLSVAKTFARSAEDAGDPLILEALGMGSCLDAKDWSALSSRAEAVAAPSAKVAALFLSKVEDLLHLRDGVPFTRPWLPPLKAVSREELCAGEFTAKELAAYPDYLPPVVVTTDDFRCIMEKIVSDRFGSPDQRSQASRDLRIFLKANAYDLESEEGTLVFFGWNVAKAMYSKSESAFAEKWR